MANFFNSVLKLGEHSVTQPFKAVKQTVQGHPDKAFKDFFSDADRRSQDVAHSVGIRGWVGKHPMQTVGAAVATIFGGWAAWGAYGAGAAGGAAGAGTGSSGIAAGTAIGQTVPMTPAMVGAAAQGGTVASTGATIGMSGSAAANAAALTSTSSMEIAAGASSTGVSLSSGGAPATHLTGQTAEIGNTGFNSAGSGDWMDWANKANQARNMMQNSNGQQQGQQQQQRQLQPQSVDLLHSLMGNQLRSTQGADSGQMQPQSTTDIIGGNKNYNGSSFSNQF